MRIRQWTRKRVVSRFVTQATCVLAVALLSGSAALAGPTILIAGNDPAVPSSFTLDFGEAGGIASARIATTDIALEVDPDRGTARFAEYFQEVEPLLLPGGISTGNLTIEIVQGSSVGSYDQLTGEFVTEDRYAIHFEGDLSAFGLESPLILESTSSGVVTLHAELGSRIAMDWSGDGILVNPLDPTSLLEFSYTCRVSAAFDAEPASLLRLALVPQVINLELPLGMERNLTAKLLGTVDNLSRGHERAAVGTLGAFVHSVNAASGRRIAEVEADDLIDAADAIAAMLRE